MCEQEDKYFDFGEIPLKDADGSNLPVNCYLFEPDNDIYWHWTASNYMPRRGVVSGLAYEIRAVSKKDILNAVRKYVVPLYEKIVESLKEDGET